MCHTHKKFKTGIKLRIVLKKVNKTIKFTQKASLEPYIKTNTDLRKKQQMILKKTFLSWWITQVLEKLWRM